MRRLRALDLHAHVDAGIEPAELTALEAVVFAATRSLDEAEQVSARTDSMTIWGVGCHPGLVGSQKSFDVERFRALIGQSAFVAEMGLDGGSRVPIETQKRTLGDALSVLVDSPRITSLHSYRATSEVLELLEQYPQAGVVLHWWLGTEEETHRAIQLGCYFSINRSSVRREDLLSLIPLERVFAETDHPFGDKGRGIRRPGEVSEVETAIGKTHGLAAADVRKQTWINLSSLVSDTRVGPLLPTEVRRQLVALARIFRS
ncbi:MAG: TatD family hydrolase [Acidimicrobiales bacterium]